VLIISQTNRHLGGWVGIASCVVVSLIPAAAEAHKGCADGARPGGVGSNVDRQVRSGGVGAHSACGRPDGGAGAVRVSTECRAYGPGACSRLRSMSTEHVSRRSLVHLQGLRPLRLARHAVGVTLTGATVTSETAMATDLRPTIGSSTRCSRALSRYRHGPRLQEELLRMSLQGRVRNGRGHKASSPPTA
jgi:hypothetical protein